MNQDKTVGVIDDDEAIRFSLQMLFEVSGLAVDTFASAEEFLDHPAPDKYQCLIVDYRLPGINGLEFLDQLNRMQIRVPTIVCSGFVSVGEEEAFLNAGAIEVLHKPIEAKLIIPKVLRIIES